MATGQPEAFELISTTKPPKIGAVIPLLTGLGVPTAKRPLKDLAPCPICSAEAPKFAVKGTLIWCAESQAIYFIGPDCHRTWFEGGRFDIELNRLRRTQADLGQVERLEGLIAGAADRRDWIEQHLVAAERISREHTRLAQDAPRFRGMLSRRLKGSTTNDIKGDGFLRGSWTLGSKLREADAIWSRLGQFGGHVEDLAPSVVQGHLKDAAKADAAMKFAYDRMSEAAAFLSAANVAKIANLGHWDRLVVRFDTIQTASSVTIQADGGERWRGPIGVAHPTPLPI